MDGKIYEGAYSEAETINGSFQSVFARESNFIVMQHNRSNTREIEVDVTEVKKYGNRC